MPKDFLLCVQQKGKVITKILPGNKFVRLCKDKSGKWHRGEVQKRANMAKALQEWKRR